MKKLISLTLAVLMALSLAACADAQPGESDSGTAPSQNTTSPDGTAAPIVPVTEAETEPQEDFTHAKPVVILVQGTNDVKPEATGNSVLSEALVDRDAAFAAMWSSAPKYLYETANLGNQAMAGEDNYDFCIFGLASAIQTANQKLAQDVSGLLPHPDSAAWEQGLTSLTFSGKTLLCAPSAGLSINDGTYAVFYDAKADGGALSGRLESFSNGWTWEQMYALEAESAALASQGMFWGERTLSALFIAGGFRLTPDSIEDAEFYMDPMIIYAADKTTVPAVTDGSPFKSGDRVFSIGTLSWLNVGDQAAAEQLTVLPMPGKTADQADIRTTSFGAGCTFVPATVKKERVVDCAEAMYVFAKATYDKVRTPYLDQRVPASSALSRSNVEKLMASRAYDLALNANSSWHQTDYRRVRSFISTNRQVFKREAATWSRYYTSADTGSN